MPRIWTLKRASRGRPMFVFCRRRDKGRSHKYDGSSDGGVKQTGYCESQEGREVCVDTAKQNTPASYDL